jgi:hypothetical protein
MKTLLAATLGLTLIAGAAVAQTPAPAAPAAAAPAAGKLSADSTLEALLANPKSHAVLEKHLPIIVQYADMIPGGMTLKQLSEMEEAKAVVTPEAVKMVIDDLAKL